MQSKITIEDKKYSSNKKQFKIKYKKNALEYIDIEFEKQKDPKYKTEICLTFKENGVCPYGNRCRFAHGKNELFLKEINHPNYKRKDCLSFHVEGFCNYGLRCHFKHIGDFSELPRSFFQLYLMIYANDILKFSDIKNYFSSENYFAFESTGKDNLFNFDSICKNTSNNFNSEKVRENIKDETIYCKQSIDKKSEFLKNINYKYDAKKKINQNSFSNKKNFGLIYRKRLSVFQNISRSSYLRKKSNYKDIRTNSFIKSDYENSFNNLKFVKEEVNDNFYLVNPQEIQRNLQNLINHQKLAKIFIPRNFRNEEYYEINNNRKLENNSNAKIIEDNFFNQKFNIDTKGLFTDKYSNINKKVNMNEENSINKIFHLPLDIIYKDFISSKEHSLNTSKVSLSNSNKINNYRIVDGSKKNDCLKKDNSLNEKINSFSILDTSLFNAKVNNYPNEFPFKNKEIKTNFVNSEKKFNHVNILNYSNDNIETKIKNNDKNTKYNTYQKVKNNSKYDEKDFLNKNLDFSLCDCTTNFDNFYENLYQDNISLIEKFDFNCISAKNSFDLNDDTINFKYFNNDDRYKN